MVTRSATLKTAIRRDLSYREARFFFKSKNQKFIRKQTYYALKSYSIDKKVSNKRFSTKLSRKYKKIIIIKPIKPVKPVKPIKPPVREIFKSLKMSYHAEIYEDSDPSSNRTISKLWGRSLSFDRLMDYNSAMVRFRNFKILVESELMEYNYLKRITFKNAYLYDINNRKIRIA